jgi:hypothetical protein
MFGLHGSIGGISGEEATSAQRRNSLPKTLGYMAAAAHTPISVTIEAWSAAEVGRICPRNSVY